MKLYIKLQLILFLLLPLLSLAHGDDEYGCHVKDPKGKYREHNVDFLTMFLEVDFDIKNSRVNGNVQYTFTPKQFKVDTLFLDAPSINIEYVLVDNDTTSFYTNKDGLIIQFKETLTWGIKHSLNIKYTASPQKGIYFIGWNDPTQRSLKQIWTQGQGIDNRHWIPSYDDVNDKLITETKITFETGYEVISNGVLKSKIDLPNNKTTWHYAMSKPHVVYLVMIAIGDYKFKDEISKNGIVSKQYYYTNEPHKYQPTYQYSAEMMDWMEEEFSSKYPWEIYRNIPVQDFIYGAMENTTATIFGDFYLQDSRAALERNYLSTNAHELVHQWFGDYITEWSGTHHWLHESFATHYAKHFKRFVLGEDDFQWERRKEMESAWRASKRDDMPVAHSQAGAARHYPKGSLVIDMLRYVVGEDNYKKVIGEFLAEHPYDLVDTHLFYLQFMKTLGVNLDWFFDQWLYRGGEPTYKVSHIKNKRNTEIKIEQTHEITDLIGLFKMPFTIQVYYKDGTFDEKTVWIENEAHIVIFEKEEKKQVDFVLFDPNWNVLKNVEFEKSMFEWMAQAEKAPNMIDRYDAIVALKNLEIPMKRKFLSSLYENETFHATKAAIIDILLNDDNEISFNLVNKALNDNDVLVRREVLDKTKVIDKKQLKSFEKILKDDSYVNIEKALLKLCKDFPENCDKYLKETEKEVGFSKNIRLSWLKLASASDSKHFNELADYAGESFEFRTRIKAMQILTELNYFDNVVMANIIDGYFNFNRVTSGASKNAILNYSADNELKVRMLNYLVSIQKSIKNQDKLDALMAILKE